MSAWQVGLLIAVPLGFVVVTGVFAWAASTGRDRRWGSRSSAWVKRHPVLWGVIYGAVWAIPGPIWLSRGHVGMAVFYTAASIAFGVLGWWRVTRAADQRSSDPTISSDRPG